MPRVQFGKAFCNWRSSAGLSQDQLALATKQLGAPLANSFISKLENASVEPKIDTFVKLAKLNKFLADKSGLLAIQDQSLRSALEEADVFCVNDGAAAMASDFFGMFIGEQPIPEKYLQGSEGDLEAETRVTELVQEFNGLRSREGSIAAAWSVINDALAAKKLSATQRDRAQALLFGLEPANNSDLVNGLIDALQSSFDTNKGETL
tara:strand:+ start:401 stop:1021 length:621 start_codon:yes stop_codon:yes gene_type:complete